MKSICFFNHYHNGDLAHSKSFIKEITSNIKTKFYYGHGNSSIVISDLNVQHAPVPNIGCYEKFLDTEEIFYINTWIGCYFIGDNGDRTGICTLTYFYNMFDEIYQKINQVFGTNLSLNETKELYLPFVDYSKFDCSKVDEFLSNHKGKKILLSNGPCYSGQCDYVGDMEPIITNIAEQNPDKIFICTHKFNSNLNNIKFTNDIIDFNGCDLNEISYLSTFCDIIVGRNSGPFCFCTTFDNLNNPDKIFYAFGGREVDCFAHGLNISCEFIFEYYTNIEQLNLSISSLVNKL